MTFTPRSLQPDGRVITTDPPYDGWEVEMRLDIAEQREGLLEQLPTSGVVHNVDKIASYLNERGMTFAPYRVVDSQDPANRSVFAAYGISFKNEKGITGSYTTQGYYNSLLGVILLARPPRYASRQPEFSLVYCNANAYGVTEYDVYLDEDGEEIYRELVQRGFKSRDAQGKAQGSLGERSFASLISGDYRRDLHVNQDIGYPSDNPIRVRGAGHVHPKYRQEGAVDVNVLGAMAFEVLCAHDPGLAPAILEARRSKAGIDAMLARMEAISPGLGKQMLQEAPVGLERFVPFEGRSFLRHALRATGISTGDILDISEDAPFSRYFETMRAEALAGAGAEEQAARERIEARPDPQAADQMTQIINEVAGTMQGAPNDKPKGVGENNQTESS